MHEAVQRLAAAGNKDQLCRELLDDFLCIVHPREKWRKEDEHRAGKEAAEHRERDQLLILTLRLLQPARAKHLSDDDADRVS